jgi:hypothetical protein
MGNISGSLQNAKRREERLPIWLMHIWQRKAQQRLGLILGAGVSHDAGCPLWDELLNRLTKKANLPPELVSAHRAEVTNTFLAEIIYRRHVAGEIANHPTMDPEFLPYQIKSSWREKIHECLYADIEGKSFNEISASHSYLSVLAELVYKSRFAVTFNFDDIVDEAVYQYAAEVGGFNPEIIVKPKIESRPEAPVIYHINGSIPREKIRRPSENLVLTEDAFADILLSPNSQDAEFVVTQFAVRTFLFFGISLSDNSLKNLLRAGAKRNPANHHFIVYHEKETLRTEDERKDIFDVNLHVYNLISIFLTTSELKSVLEFLNQEKPEEFREALLDLAGRKPERKYYLVGSIAAGKSSVLEALRCFSTYEEWSGRPPAVMYQDDKTLTDEQQQEVDAFLFKNLRLKNQRMIDALHGVHVMDRAYLDLFAFSKDAADVVRKANQLKSEVIAKTRALESGQIIFLRAEEDALRERLARRGSRKGPNGEISFNADRLVQQEETLRKVYKPVPDAIFNTSQKSIGETAQQIARMILLKDYSHFDFCERIDEVIVRNGEL